VGSRVYVEIRDLVLVKSIERSLFSPLSPNCDRLFELGHKSPPGRQSTGESDEVGMKEPQ
jgi:hypothetical protein